MSDVFKSISRDNIMIELSRGVSSDYYIATFGSCEFYCDEDGLIKEMANHFEGEHPAYRSRWNIKKFNRNTLTLMDVSVSKIAQIVHEATRLYLKRIVDSKFK